MGLFVHTYRVGATFVRRFIPVGLIIASMLLALDVVAGGTYRISGNPRLWVSDEERDLPPVIPPKPREIGVGEAQVPMAMQVYDAATGKVTQIASEDLQQSMELGLDSAPSYPGMLPPDIAPEGLIVPESVIGGDGRVRVTPTTSYPWRTICKLYLYSNNGTYVGSGVLIGRSDGNGFHVYTAGHCVYYPYYFGGNGFVTGIKVIPALDGSYKPFAEAWAVDWTVPSPQWNPWLDHRYDWAIIRLDRSVGNWLGWMGRVTFDSDDSVYTETELTLAGYPADLMGGLGLYKHSDYGCSANQYNHWYSMDSYGGQSGCPVFYESDTDVYDILTIHAYGVDGTGCNHGTRLRDTILNATDTWINSHPLPDDKADLIDDGQDYSGFSPSSVEPDDTFDVWCDVRNMGTDSSGSFNVAFYASADTTITTSDYLIATHEDVSSIDPFFTSVDSQWSGSFPDNSTVPTGTYYVGWIIDSAGIVDEFDEGNNTAYVEGSQLVVNEPTMVVLSSFTAKAADSEVTLSWRTEVEIDNVGFVIYRSGTKDGNYTRIAFVPGAEDSETSNDYQFTDNQAQPGNTYYYYLEDVDLSGKRTKTDVIQVNLPVAQASLPVTALPIQTELSIVPEQSFLLANYPNPFNPETWIPYNLAEAADVIVQIYDARGRLIRRLDLGHQPAGFYLSKDRAAYWNGQDKTGRQVSSGIYYYHLSAGSFSAVRKMVVLE